MPPVTILSPYSGRPVKVREHDLGRAIRDEEGRVFYVVEDPEHGRYAARTRKGSPKDLERYRKLSSSVATLEGESTPTDPSAQRAHDATGTKRRNPIGLVVLLLFAGALIAAGYVYLNHPGLIGLDPDAAEPAEPSDDAQPPADASSNVLPIDRSSRLTIAYKPGLSRQPSDPSIALRPSSPRSILPDKPIAESLADAERRAESDADADPAPVIVPTWPEGKPATTVSSASKHKAPARRPAPRVAFISTPSPRQARAPYDDFRHTASGLRYKITHPTDGASARAGHYLTIRYTARALDGRPLIDDGQQSFTLMSGQAIRAFDEGLAGIREGEKLRLLVPRGHSDSGTLPGLDRLPDEPFLLDVQVVSVRPGVTHVVETPGDPDRRPAMPGDTVLIHYIATVEGRDDVIDATIHRGEPLAVTLGLAQVIDGLELGLTGMRPGESRLLTIPPYLAYGEHSVAGGLIPKNAVLSFRVSLVDIVEDDAP